MPTDQAVIERLGQLGPVFRSGDAVRAGISWRDLYRVRDAGLLVELSRGLFHLAENGRIDHADFVSVCARAPRGMICLGSALAYWDLGEQLPGGVDLAVPSGAHRPQIDHPDTRVHVFQASTFDAGSTRVEVAPRVGFTITGVERTVVDCFRLRSRIGDEIGLGGLRRYVRRPDASPARVLELAGAFRVGPSLLQALRLLVG